MAAPKLTPEQLKRLYQDANNSPLQEKKSVESLIKRLNDKIQNDPGMSKKAALIIENWLKKKPKP